MTSTQPTQDPKSYDQTPNIEIKAKIEALDKLIMGAGEYHDDPYEYVVPLRHIKEYRAELSEFDLSQPIFRDKTTPTPKPLDELIEDIISHPDGSVSDNQLNAIKSLIANAEKQARLVELKDFRQNWHTLIRQEIHQDLNDRIKELENSN